MKDATWQLAIGVALVVTSGLIWNAMSAHRQAALVGASRMEQTVADLEARVAMRPDDTGAVLALCRAYLDRGEPGFALAAIHRASRRVRRDARVQHLWAEALLRAGDAQQAWERERAAYSQCFAGRCPTWLAGSIGYRRPFFEALSRSGVKDYRRAPERTLEAYEQVPRTWLRIATE